MFYVRGSGGVGVFLGFGAPSCVAIPSCGFDRYCNPHVSKHLFLSPLFRAAPRGCVSAHPPAQKNAIQTSGTFCSVTWLSMAEVASYPYDFGCFSKAPRSDRTRFQVSELLVESAGEPSFQSLPRTWPCTSEGKSSPLGRPT